MHGKRICFSTFTKHPKKIFILETPVEKNDIPVPVAVTFKSQEDLQQFCHIHCGSLRSSNSLATFDTLEDERVYTFFGSLHIISEKQRSNVDKVILRLESALAVKISINDPSGHIHPNVEIKKEDNSKLMLDAAGVHIDDEVSEATAYIVESAYCPEVNEVNTLLKKVETFSVHKNSINNSHFRSVSKVVPVLAGRLWPSDTLVAAKLAGVWQVKPSGGGYEVVRSVHTLLRRIYLFK